MPWRARVFSLAPAKAAGYAMAPTPTIRPCPGMRRGTECRVPIMPGLVSVTVVPRKSSTSSPPARALATSSS